ncbi:50S ribosomal protein L6 [Candidatus Peregrinibacteria bacterium]|nr:50S ribosomal protein L6 [Candidatus Peregrinibacteria bacterium]
MSRIGKLPINIPNGVTVINDQNVITVKGPKGELKTQISPKINIRIDDNIITVTRPNDQKKNRELHGLSRTLIANMIKGVTDGYEKKLEILGVGYRANVQGKKVVLNLGYSHPIEFTPPEGVNIELDPEKKNILVIKGINKQHVGEAAAKIRSFRSPEPYKGKGVRYLGEYVAMKAGKAAGKDK